MTNGDKKMRDLEGVLFLVWFPIYTLSIEGTTMNEPLREIHIEELLRD